MSARDLSYIAMFAALVAVLGLFPPVAVPIVPVPITAQTLGVMLAGSLLGARRGALSLVAFLALVAVGLPVLSGGRGGLGVFAGPSGGFLLAWPLGAAAIGLLTERLWPGYSLARALLANAVGGILVIYAVGVPFLAAVADLTLAKAAAGSLAFIPGDLVKVAVASAVAVTVQRAYPVLQPSS